jgi:hypothetical protein
MMKATGWAVAKDGHILVRTVSPTRNIALVNWLITEGRTMVLDTASDQQIEGLFNQIKTGHEAVVEVEIRAVPKP